MHIVSALTPGCCRARTCLLRLLRLLLLLLCSAVVYYISECLKMSNARQFADRRVEGEGGTVDSLEQQVGGGEAWGTMSFVDLMCVQNKYG